MASDARAAVEARIPHRAPFLFVDRIVDEGADRILTEWTVPPDADFFRGHYPGRPVLPGVIAAEFAFQSAALLLARDAEPDAPGVPALTKIEAARYRRPVGPGETLRAEVSVTERLGRACWAAARLTDARGATVLRLRFVVALSELEV